MFEYLKHIDEQLFLTLNGWHAPFWDSAMYYFSKIKFWIPLLALLFYVMIKKLNTKQIILALLCIGLVITFCDQLSVKAFKNVFVRYRPCHNLNLQDLVHLVKGCGGKYGFVSSHAANHFGISVFLGLLLFKKNALYLGLLIFWAALVSYSRIYLGVHYPADVLGGALLGSTIAFIFYKIYTLIYLKNTRYNELGIHIYWRRLR